jgi:hypothetical protein
MTTVRRNEPESKLNYQRFSDLKEGDWFYFAGDIYVKTENIVMDCNFTANAFHVLCGQLAQIREDFEVTKISEVNLSCKYERPK